MPRAKKIHKTSTENTLIDWLISGSAAKASSRDSPPIGHDMGFAVNDGTEIDLGRELAIAVRAVRSAAIVCRAVQRNLLAAACLTKDDRSPVTVADFASQAVVCAAL